MAMMSFRFREILLQKMYYPVEKVMTSCTAVREQICLMAEKGMIF
jgi:hypothetical protein